MVRETIVTTLDFGARGIVKMTTVLAFPEVTARTVCNFAKTLKVVVD
jgi:hypothetical protein